MKYEIIDSSNGRYKNIVVYLTRYEALNLIADLSMSMAEPKIIGDNINLIEYDRANSGDILHFCIENKEQHELTGLSKDEKHKAEYIKTVGKP